MTHLAGALCSLALLAAPLAAEAQPTGPMARVGVLTTNPESVDDSRITAFREEMKRLGYVEGQSLVLEFRHAGEDQRFDDLAADLVRLKVDVIVAAGTPAILAAKKATSDIPIVFPTAGDPVGQGLVASLAHPGGNVTGLSNMGPEIATKQMELLTPATARWDGGPTC